MLALFDLGIQLERWKKVEEARYILAGLALVSGGAACGDGVVGGVLIADVGPGLAPAKPPQGAALQSN